MNIEEVSPWKCITPFGTGTARWVSDGNEVLWGVVQKKTGEIWWWPNNEIRWAQDLSGGVNTVSTIHMSVERGLTLLPHMKRHE